jgi:Tol biopolymer transport system component/imidazolonepropionase-like amidohydrolase
MRRLFLVCTFGLIGGCATSEARNAARTETIAVDTREGTALAFDVSPSDGSIVFDLFGQLWTVPTGGGAARAITDAVRDTAEDLDPSFSTDGRGVAFHAERAGKRGLWLLDLGSGKVRQLTRLGNPDEYHGDASWSPDGRTIAFTRMAADSADHRWHSRIALVDVASGSVRVIPIEKTQKLEMRAPTWTPDGRQIAFVAASPANPRGGRLHLIDIAGGRATPLSVDSTPALGATFSPDGKRIAFLARDSASRVQVYVQDVASDRAAAPARLTSHDDVSFTRVRWTRDGSAILYSADGKLRKVAARGGESAIIEFNAHLAITRAVRNLRSVHFTDPGKTVPARAFLGLALSPDAQRIAAIALGKLWIIDVNGPARAIVDVPWTARGLAWSPDGNEVAWSAGMLNEEDLYAANIRTGATRQLTALPGREALPAYSPDGRYLAFMHQKGEVGALRLIDAHPASAPKDTTQTRRLGVGAVSWTRGVDTYPQWSPQSNGLLLVGPSDTDKPTTATIVRLDGKRDTITKFVDAPIFLSWNRNGTLTYVRHDRLWRAQFDGSRMVRGAPKAIASDAALYASTSNDGSILYISTDGLRLRSPTGSLQHLGWPITYTPAPAPALVIRNARIIDGLGNAASAPADIVVEQGRITRIAAGGTITSDARVMDATGKFVMPGLMELHAHTYRPDLLAATLYYGITTIRDQGSSIAPLVAYGDGIAAGITAGSRVTYGGFQFYSDWPFDEEQGRGIEPEADSQHVKRSVSLAEAFGAQHIKTRTFRRWDINARMIAEAHRRGMRATGHCSTQLPLIAAGMDAKEHAGHCSTRATPTPYAFNDVLLYDDQVQLFRAAQLAFVPTISYLAFAVRVGENPKLLDADSDVTAFASREDFTWMLEMDKASRERTKRAVLDARTTVAKLLRAGVTVGTGTDLWQYPAAVHLELEELVAAGLTPAEAIRASTSSAARIIGAERELGSIEVGKLGDLVILDASPLDDIRNTRRISAVVQNGRVVNRSAIRDSFAQAK